MTSKKNLLKKLKGIYAIIDPEVCVFAGNDPLSVAKDCLEEGVKIIQLRYKNASDAEILTLAEKLKKECKKNKALFIMNDRADLALLSGAEGLHLGQKDLPVKAARNIFNGVIGISTHNDKEISQALKDEVDYIGFGPVFFTRTKKGLPTAAGINCLKSVVSKVDIPVAAIGGINKDNIRDVFKTGAACSAIISAICTAKEPNKAIKEMIRGL